MPVFAFELERLLVKGYIFEAHKACLPDPFHRLEAHLSDRTTHV
jgi:hypothetical protein